MSHYRNELFTIGHSAHSFDEFVALLKRHAITALADVRSQPYSRRFEQFNREAVAAGLDAACIRYAFLGEELGARRREPECYQEDRADYRRIAMLPKFRAGLERLRHGAAQFRIALMCAEKEPLDCHRMILICRELRDEFQIMHILEDGALEPHTQTEKRLLRAMDVSRTLFDPELSDEQLIQQAYDKRAEQIAYRITEERVPQ